jgi:hypothetical protein
MDENYALTRLYHPKGPQVSIPLSLMDELTIEQGMRLISSVDALLAAGWTVDAPGVEAGEKLAELGFVVRREKYNKDDRTRTPIVDLYENKDARRGGAYKLLHIYLNTPDDVAAFEAATGMKLAQLPLYSGDAAIQRDTGKDEFVVKFARPVKMVYKDNPEYEGANDKKHQKRLFVRWYDSRPLPAQNQPTSANTQATQADTGELYLVGAKDLVETIQGRTGLKPTAFMPILSKSGKKQITLTEALALIEQNLK